MFEVVLDSPRVPASLVEQYRRIAPSTLGHIMDGRAMDGGIRPVRSPCAVVGPAVTVRVEGRDSTVCHKVIELLQPGDVVVVTQDARRYACWGEMVTLAAQLHGAAGAVLDGPVTDVVEVRESGLPVFARGTSPLTTQLLGRGGGINVPIECGGVPVRPGELILASDDGIIILSPGEAEDLLAAAVIEEREDAEYRAGLLEGKLPSELAPIAKLMEGAAHEQ